MGEVRRKYAVVRQSNASDYFDRHIELISTDIDKIHDNFIENINLHPHDNVWVDIVHRLANIEFLESDINKHTDQGEIYLARWKKLYQIHYSRNAGYYTSLLYDMHTTKYRVPFTKRGQSWFIDGKTVNKIMDCDFVHENITTL